MCALLRPVSAAPTVQWAATSSSASRRRVAPGCARRCRLFTPAHPVGRPKQTQKGVAACPPAAVFPPEAPLSGRPPNKGIPPGGKPLLPRRCQKAAAARGPLGGLSRGPSRRARLSARTFCKCRNEKAGPRPPPKGGALEVGGGDAALKRKRVKQQCSEMLAATSAARPPPRHDSRGVKAARE